MSFDRNLFTYDEQNHLGYYNGKLVPSVTQLVDLVYPMNENIPLDRLQNAADKGSELHEALLTVNTMFDNPKQFGKQLEDTMTFIQGANVCKQELNDYLSLLSVYGLRPFDYENLVFLLDENDELVCYGHYDCVVQATKDIDIGDKHLFTENYLYLIDYKRTSSFNRQKVGLQTSIYSVAYEQMSKNFISNVYGVWFNEGIKLIPLNRQDNDFIISLCKKLKQVWENKNG